MVITKLFVKISICNASERTEKHHIMLSFSFFSPSDFGVLNDGLMRTVGLKHRG